MFLGWLPEIGTPFSPMHIDSKVNPTDFKRAFGIQIQPPDFQWGGGSRRGPNGKLRITAKNVWGATSALVRLWPNYSAISTFMSKFVVFCLNTFYAREKVSILHGCDFENSFTFLWTACVLPSPLWLIASEGRVSEAPVVLHGGFRTKQHESICGYLCLCVFQVPMQSVPSCANV